MAKRRKTVTEWDGEKEIVVEDKESYAVGKRAVIIGGGVRARDFDFAMFDDKNTEVWGINAIRPEWVDRWTRFFNLHRYELLKRYGWPVNIEGEWLVKHRDVWFCTMDEWPDGRIDRKYTLPRESMALSDVMRGARHNYHCNSFDWLIAYALHIGIEKLTIHGCKLALDAVQEQMSARACAEYWTGFATGRGMEIEFVKTDLFKAYHIVKSDRIYGVDDSPTWEDRTAEAIPGEPPYRFDDRG